MPAAPHPSPPSPQFAGVPSHRSPTYRLPAAPPAPRGQKLQYAEKPAWPEWPACASVATTQGPKELWVGPDGAGNGLSASSPFPTVHAALATATAGTTIHVLPGAYKETVAEVRSRYPADTPRNKIALIHIRAANTGAPNAPIVIRATKRWAAEFRYDFLDNDLLSVWPRWSQTPFPSLEYMCLGIRVEPGVCNVVIDGLKFVGVTIGADIWNDTRHITLRNCLFEQIGATKFGYFKNGRNYHHGIFTAATSMDVTIDRCVFRHFGAHATTANPADSNPKQYGSATELGGPKTNATYHHAYIHWHACYLQGFGHVVRSCSFSDITQGGFIKVDGNKLLPGTPDRVLAKQELKLQVQAGARSHVIKDNCIGPDSNPNSGAGQIILWVNPSNADKPMNPPKNVLIQDNIFEFGQGGYSGPDKIGANEHYGDWAPITASQWNANTGWICAHGLALVGNVARSRFLLRVRVPWCDLNATPTKLSCSPNNAKNAGNNVVKYANAKWATAMQKHYAAAPWMSQATAAMSSHEWSMLAAGGFVTTSIRYIGASGAFLLLNDGTLALFKVFLRTATLSNVPVPGGILAARDITMALNSTMASPVAVDQAKSNAAIPTDCG